MREGDDVRFRGIIQKAGMHIPDGVIIHNAFISTSSRPERTGTVLPKCSQNGRQTIIQSQGQGLHNGRRDAPFLQMAVKFWRCVLSFSSPSGFSSSGFSCIFPAGSVIRQFHDAGRGFAVLRLSFLLPSIFQLGRFPALFSIFASGLWAGEGYAMCCMDVFFQRFE